MVIIVKGVVLVLQNELVYCLFVNILKLNYDNFFLIMIQPFRVSRERKLEIFSKTVIKNIKFYKLIMRKIISNYDLSRLGKSRFGLSANSTLTKSEFII